MSKITKLTDEYASNLNVLFLNVDSNVASYYGLFSRIFKECTLVHYHKRLKKSDFSYVDIVFIKIDNNSKFKTTEEMRLFTEFLRRENELLPIYIIKENIKDVQIIDLMNRCYCIDGFLPTPFEKERVYRFLYRVLKRVTVLNELHSYIEDLEQQLFSVVIDSEEKIVSSEVKQRSPKRDEQREKQIRFSQDDKISATEFMDILDDSIVDKIEDMEMELESLMATIYTLEESDTSSNVRIIREDIEPIIVNIFVLVESIGYFSVTAKAFESLKIFLATLSEEELENSEQKALFIQMLLAVIQDLEKWLQVIFIDHSTEDIHYLDASFYSNIVEMEQIFTEDDDSDDDDLEFF